MKALLVTNLVFSHSVTNVAWSIECCDHHRHHHGAVAIDPSCGCPSIQQGRQVAGPACDAIAPDRLHSHGCNRVRGYPLVPIRPSIRCVPWWDWIRTRVDGDLPFASRVFIVLCLCRGAVLVPSDDWTLGGVQALLADVGSLYFRRLALAHFFFAAVHSWFLTAPLADRMYHRLRFLIIRGRVRPGPTNEWVSRNRVILFLKQIHTSLFSRSGVFGVDGIHFDTIFLIREVAEMVLQSYQGYQMSRMLPRATLNRFFVGMLVVNCWSTPLLGVLIAHNKPLQRLLCLLSDILLDFISTVVVPAILAFSYRKHVGVDYLDFEYLWYNDSYLVNVISETPMILFATWVDAFSRLLYSISLLLAMDDLKALIDRRSVRHDNAAATKGSVSTGNVQRRLSPPTIAQSRFTSLTRRLMTIYGFAVLAVYTHAQSKPSLEACVLEVRPWLVRKPACAMIEVNCHTNAQYTGNAPDIDRILGSIEPGTLAHFVIRHCSQVEMTPQLRAFSNLRGMKLYNSTLAKWGEEVALTEHDFPNMRFLFFVYTRFPNDTLPDGLLSFDFPRNLLDIEIIKSHVSLPDDLHERWPSKLALLLEYADLDAFPRSLRLMHAPTVSLSGNRLESLHEDDLLSPGLYQLDLSGNPLTYLPELHVQPSNLRMLYLDSTNLSALPDWFDESFFSNAYVFAGDTPLCRNLLKNTNSSERDRVLATSPWLQNVDCEELDGPFGFYPLEMDVREDETW